MYFPDKFYFVLDGDIQARYFLIVLNMAKHKTTRIEFTQTELHTPGPSSLCLAACLGAAG